MKLLTSLATCVFTLSSITYSEPTPYSNYINNPEGYSNHANAHAFKHNAQKLRPRARPSGSSFGVPANATYDYVIVGGGTAGLLLANRLSANPAVSVAVIEAGSFYEFDGNYSQIPAFDTAWVGKDPQDTNPVVDWSFVTVPQKGALDAKIHYARGKTFGGSSARNYMGYLRSTKQAYKKWADQVGDQTYTYEKWLPYHQRHLDYTPSDSRRAKNATADVDEASLGKGGPLKLTLPAYAQPAASYVQQGLKEIGIQPIDGITSGKLIGSSYVIATIDPKTQQRDSSETAFLQPALTRTNLYVYQLSLAKKVLFNGDKRATGVAVDTEGAEYILSAKNEVILSAGAFQSPQLLMVSGVGPASSLSKHNIPVVADRPGVGQNMWDHILMGPAYRLNVVTGSSLGNPANLAKASAEFQTSASGILTSPGGDFGAWENLPPKSRKAMPKSALADLDKNFPEDWPDIEYLSIAGYLGLQNNFIRDSPTDGYNYATVAIALTAPLSRGTIDISSADMADQPLIDPRWLTHPTDVAVAIAAYKRVRELFQTKSLKKVTIGDEYFPGKNATSDEDILGVIRKSVSTVYHAAATCAMGKPGDKKAVVDKDAKVIGVKGLRVVDASAFPFLPPGHPMATVYGLAELIAERILKGQ